VALLCSALTVATEVAPSVPILAKVVARGWVCSHSARAGTAGSKTVFLPRSGFIATAMDLTAVAAAHRDGELIADCSRAPVLREPQMVGIRRTWQSCLATDLT